MVGLEHDSYGHSHGHSHKGHHHTDFDPGSMYGEEWVGNLIRDITQGITTNLSWVGLKTDIPQRILDYGCGNGTITLAVSPHCPRTTFRGIDSHPAQVKRYNDAVKMEFKDEDRACALVGNLGRPSSELQNTDWFNFDAAITSMVLHHVDSPLEIIRSLISRVKSGGVIAIVEFVGASSHDHSHGHNLDQDGANRIVVTGGQEIWPGFTEESLTRLMKTAGLTDVDTRLHDGLSHMPEAIGGDKQIFFARGTVA